MSYFIKIFLVYIFLYAVLTTALVHNGHISQTQIAITKEIFWFGFLAILAIKYRYLLFQYIKHFYIYYFVLIVLVLIGISVTFVMQTNDPNIYQNIIIGLKYGLLFMAIMLGASFVGYIYYHENNDYKNLLKDILQLLLFFLLIGLLWQGAKFIWPDFFIKYLGFGPIGDFDFGNPPLYYRTGPGGVPRYNGVFAGPNNLGFLLVLFWSVVIFAKNLGVKAWQKIIYAIVCLLILSRGLIVGVIVQSFIYFFMQKSLRKYIYKFVSILILVIIGLSLYKWQSTLDHLSLFFISISKFAGNIYGYGLGSSGPAVHRHGNILPENFYLQILIDFGIFGFLIFVARRYIYIRKSIKLIKSDYIYMLLSLGMIGVFVEGLFLHVREDSMVNYIFIVIYGIARGYNVHKDIYLKQKTTIV